MSETTLAVPLSGEEVVESIKERVGTMMYQDCHLNPALAYEAYEAEVYIRLKLRDPNRSEQHSDFEVKMRAGDPASLADVEPREAFSKMEYRPPNAVRQQAGMAIPTLVENSQGRKEVQHVKYPKEPAK